MTAQSLPGMGTLERQFRETSYPISEAHPEAERYPWMSDDELAELAADIVRNGQQLPNLRLTDDRILDGRNRELACRIAGIEPAYGKVDIPDGGFLIPVLDDLA